MWPSRILRGPALTKLVAPYSVGSFIIRSTTGTVIALEGTCCLQCCCGSPSARERVWKECGAYYVARISIIQASRLLFKWFKCQELKFTSLRGELRTFDCLEGGSAYDEGLSQEQASRWLAIAKFSVDSLLRLSHTPLQLTDEFSIALYHLFRCGDPDLTM